MSDHVTALRGPPTRRPVAWLSLTVDAAPPLLGVLRTAIGAWMATVCRHGPEPDAVISAVSEAAGNAMEHAYRTELGSVVIDLAVEEVAGRERIRIEVADRGRWRPPEAMSGRGNGIALMRALMADVRVETGPTGTTVHLTSHPGDPPEGRGGQGGGRSQP